MYRGYPGDPTGPVNGPLRSAIGRRPTSDYDS
jgi:hypothetical protein